LEPIVADCACCAERFVNVAGFKYAPHLRVMRPYAGKEISLKLKANRKLISISFAHSSLRGIRLVHRSQEILDVVANLVRDNVRLREVARRLEPCL
jgi:hypothetical protein